MKTKKRIIGDQGEQKAADFLEKKGFVILARNFCVRGGEIDLVAKKGEEIVFVEVKTRSSETFGHPLESITPTKIKRLSRAAWDFLETQQWERASFRFDIITIFRGEIEHLESAFEAIF